MPYSWLQLYLQRYCKLFQVDCIVCNSFPCCHDRRDRISVQKRRNGSIPLVIYPAIGVWSKFHLNTRPMLPETSAHWRTLKSRYKTQRYIIYTTRSNHYFFTSSHSIMQFKRFPSLISFMFAIAMATSLASTYVSRLTPNTRLSYTDWLTWLQQQHCCIGHYSPPKSRVLRGLPWS